MKINNYLLLFLLLPVLSTQTMSRPAGADDRAQRRRTLIARGRDVTRQMRHEQQEMAEQVEELPEADNLREMLESIRESNREIRQLFELTRQHRREMNEREARQTEARQEDTTTQNWQTRTKRYLPLATAALGGAIVYIFFRKKVPVEVVREVPIIALATLCRKFGSSIIGFFKNQTLTTAEVLQLLTLNNS